MSKTNNEKLPSAMSNGLAGTAEKSTTNSSAPTQKRVAQVVTTDNSKNGHLIARRAERRAQLEK